MFSLDAKQFELDLARHIWKGRVLKEPDNTRLTKSRCLLAGIYGKLLNSKWDYYPDSFKPKQQLRMYVDNLNAYRKTGEGLLLMGGSGKGKTFGSTLIAKEVIRRDGFPYFVRYSDLYKIMTDEDDENNQRIRLTPFLIVDDLGSGGTKSTVAAMFEELLRGREINEVATIVSTNLNTDQLVECFGTACVRVLFDLCKIVDY